MDILLVLVTIVLTFGNCNAQSKLKKAESSVPSLASESQDRMKSAEKLEKSLSPAALLIVSRSAIYRSPACEGEGYELEGTVLTTLTAVMKPELCGLQCIMLKACGSFNFYAANNTCTLLTEDTSKCDVLSPNKNSMFFIKAKTATGKKESDSELKRMDVEEVGGELKRRKAVSND